MIAMTAIVRSVDSLHTLPLLGQNLRRHYEHILLFTDQMLVMFPQVGPVLVTEEAATTRCDVVADSKAEMTRRMEAVEADVRRQAAGVPVRIEWQKSASIPVPFR
ncbi:MAG: hypothetical protein JWQ64_321 [Subtercola sp.]|jgi:hypothetical protein|nr:hypothetical protein [Subtercola sp.]